MIKKISYIVVLTVGIIFLSMQVVSYQPTQVLSPRETEHIALTAGDATYTTVTPAGLSVYEVMNSIASTTPFRFSATYYSGLGYFINQINGIKNSNGTYWTLYVDGIYSMVGASQYILKDGDVVEWRFEKK